MMRCQRLVLIAAGFVLVAVLVLFPATARAKDYLVTFMKEHYKAAAAQGGPVYQTWEVNSDFGKKLLILTGKNPVRRQWLRDFTKTTDLFLVSIPDADSATFETNSVFSVDVTAINPVDKDFVSTGKNGKGRKSRR